MTTLEEKKEILDEATQKIGEYLLNNKKYLFHIDDIVKSMGNGIVKLELRVYNGFVTDVVTSEVKRITIKGYGERVKET